MVLMNKMKLLAYLNFTRTRMVNTSDVKNDATTSMNIISSLFIIII